MAIESHLRRALIGALALLAAGYALAASPDGRKARLVVDVRIEGRGSATSVTTAEKASSRTSQELHTSVTLSTNGRLESENPNDLAGQAAQMERQMQEAQATQRPEKMKEWAAQLQQQMLNCKKDLPCINRISAEFARQSAASTPPRPAMGEKRFMRYSGYRGCQSDLGARIDTTRQGTFPDVQGDVPFTEKTTADYRATDADKAILCTAFDDLVVDTKTERIFVTLGDMPIKGTYMRTEGGRNLFNSNEQSDLRLHANAMAWVRSKLQGAARSGKEKTTLGSVNVELSWRFEDL